MTSKQRAYPVSYTHLDVYKRQGVTTVRAGETNGYSDNVSRAESLPTNLALILPVTAIIIVNKVVRSST